MLRLKFSLCQPLQPLVSTFTFVASNIHRIERIGRIGLPWMITFNRLTLKIVHRSLTDYQTTKKSSSAYQSRLFAEHSRTPPNASAISASSFHFSSFFESNLCHSIPLNLSNCRLFSFSFRHFSSYTFLLIIVCEMGRVDWLVTRCPVTHCFILELFPLFASGPRASWLFSRFSTTQTFVICHKKRRRYRSFSILFLDAFMREKWNNEKEVRMVINEYQQRKLKDAMCVPKSLKTRTKGCSARNSGKWKTSGCKQVLISRRLRHCPSASPLLLHPTRKHLQPQLPLPFFPSFILISLREVPTMCHRHPIWIRKLAAPIQLPSHYLWLFSRSSSRIQNTRSPFFRIFILCLHAFHK